MLEFWSELLVVESDDVLPRVAVGVNALDCVTRATSCGHVRDEAIANAVP